MSWTDISTELARRLSCIEGLGRVHGKIRYDDEGFDRDTFDSLFQVGGQLNVWQITRTGRTSTRSQDNSRISKVQHQVQIHGNLALKDPATGATNSEDTFQSLLDAVCDNLDQGDRTLGGKAITLSTPQVSAITPAKFYGAVLSHDATIGFTVEENVLDPHPCEADFEAYESAGDGLSAKLEPIGTALMSWLAPRLLDLGLASCGWARHSRGAPPYPADPRAELPRAFLRVSQAGHAPGRTIGCENAGMVLQVQVWLQLLQVPGQQHHRLMASAMDVMQTAIMRGDWAFPGLDVEGVYSLKAVSTETQVFEDVDHPLGDPELRVSSSQTSILLEGSLRG